MGGKKVKSSVSSLGFFLISNTILWFQLYFLTHESVTCTSFTNTCTTHPSHIAILWKEYIKNGIGCWLYGNGILRREFGKVFEQQGLKLGQTAGWGTEYK